MEASSNAQQCAFGRPNGPMHAACTRQIAVNSQCQTSGEIDARSAGISHYETPGRRSTDGNPKQAAPLPLRAGQPVQGLNTGQVAQIGGHSSRNS